MLQTVSTSKFSSQIKRYTKTNLQDLKYKIFGISLERVEECCFHFFKKCKIKN